MIDGDENLKVSLSVYKGVTNFVVAGDFAKVCGLWKFANRLYVLFYSIGKFIFS